MNIFSGGALQNMSVAAMGVYPYITSSIVMQLMVPIVPALQALSREGEQGRRQIQIYTHWMTVPMALVQGYGQLILIQSKGGISGIELTGGNSLNTISILITMTAGTMFLVWLGELISERGIGNGISLIIFAGIIGGLPQLIGGRLYTGTGEGVTATIALAVLMIGLVSYIVFFQEGQRRIPVQYSRSVLQIRPNVSPVGPDAHPPEGEHDGDDPRSSLPSLSSSFRRTWARFWPAPAPVASSPALGIGYRAPSIRLTLGTGSSSS